MNNLIKDMFSFLNIEEVPENGKLFQANGDNYVYDTCTGIVFKITEEENKVFRALFGENELSSNESLDESTVKEIAEFVEKNQLFRCKEEKKFIKYEDEFLEHKVNNDLSQIVLEVTQNCNLRCAYCIYQDGNEDFRNFEQEYMSFETAQKAIDYAAVHGRENLSITFYGGEPLIQFDLIRKIVNYAFKKMPDKKLNFSLTTNGVLMTDEIAEFIASTEGFSIMFSVDGPKELHDQCRKDVNGNGSFDRMIRGLHTMVNAFEKAGKTVRELLMISMVIEFPHTNEKYQMINDFFNGIDWLDKKVGKNVTFVSRSYNQFMELPKELQEEISKNDDLATWSYEENNGQNFFSQSLENLLLPIHRRIITDEPRPLFKNNGCCIPGSRKVYVTTDGDFKVCERIGKSPSIGNVDQGINLENIKKYYYEDYQSKSLESCKKCWARNLCSICYEKVFDENGLNMEKKALYCGGSRRTIEKSLVMYHGLLETNRDLIRGLNEIQIIV